MKIIQNKWINRYIPFPGFKACNLFGVLFVRGDDELSEVSLNHESIHTAQWKELLHVGFILWYVIEWLIRLPKGNAYHNISFEREAYDNKKNLNYLNNRKRFSFLKYL